MRERRYSGAFVLIFLLCQITLPFFTSAEILRARWLEEASALRHSFGVALGGRAVQAGLSVGAGMAELLPSVPGVEVKHLHGDTVAAAVTAGNAVLRQTEAYVRRLCLQLQVLVLRLLTCALWTLALFPLLLACIADGLLQRKVKLACLGFQNPTAFSLGQRGLLFVSLLPWVYAGLPCSVSAALVPMGVLMAAPPLCLALRHMQPIFTR